MNAQLTIQTVDEIYLKNLDAIVRGFRENNDVDEISYDIEERETLGDFIDFLIESEKCSKWDAPYVTYLALNEPSQLYQYFDL